MSTILVIDDDNDICDVLKIALEYEGFVVNCVTNPKSIFQLIDSIKPDIIILDHLLRGTNGGDLCQQIKRNPETKSLPVIMISAYFFRTDPVETYNCDVFIPKPFDLTDIVKSVTHCLNRKHL